VATATRKLDFVDRIIAKMPASTQKLADKPYFNHSNLTIRKAISFCIVSAIGGVILLGITYTMTEWGGQWYMYSAFVGGVVGVAVKFVLNSVFTYKDSK
jgi:putative flippase GtrA